MTTPSASGRRGRRALLDAGQVIDAALAILDADGLDAVTFRRLSADLGVSHMTLYGYFDSKDALLEALVARTLVIPTTRKAPSTPWSELLFDAITDLYRLYLQRPGVAEILVARELNGDWIVEPRERILDILRDGGFDERQATDGISIVFNYLLGAVLIDAKRERGGSPASFELGLRYLITGLKTAPP